jgi:hypothetical protein
MGQTSYAIAPGAGMRGLPYDTSHSVKRTCRVNAGSARPFGTFVIRGGASSAKEGDVTVLADGNSIVAGVLHHTHDIRQDPSTTALVAGVDVPDLSIVPLMESGKIYVMIEEDVAEGEPVYTRHTANGAGKLVIGACRNDIDTDKCILVKGAHFVAAGTAALGYAPIQFDVSAATV